MTIAEQSLAAATVRSRLRRLGPIGLEELVESASLQTRVDRKYVVPAAGLGPVLDGLPADTAVLEIGARRDFSYSSVYFDTPALDSYFLAARGRRRRFKIRTRTYLDSSEAYLEVKTRGGRSSTVKDRYEYDPASARELTPAGREYIHAVLTETGIRGIDTEMLVPVLTTRYSRATLFLPSSESRATIDTRLQWQLEGGAIVEKPAMTIVETKSGQRASAVDRLLWANGHRPATISKYATGMAALIPELGANKWTRVLRRDFDRVGSGSPVSDSRHSSASSLSPSARLSA